MEEVRDLTSKLDRTDSTFIISQRNNYFTISVPNGGSLFNLIKAIELQRFREDRDIEEELLSGNYLKFIERLEQLEQDAQVKVREHGIQNNNKYSQSVDWYMKSFELWHFVKEALQKKITTSDEEVASSLKDMTQRVDHLLEGIAYRTERRTVV